MNVIRQHISTHLERITRVLLPGGWRLGQVFGAFRPGKVVAIRVTKHQAMPCRLDDQTVYRGFRKA